VLVALTAYLAEPRGGPQVMRAQSWHGALVHLQLGEQLLSRVTKIDVAEVPRTAAPDIESNPGQDERYRPPIFDAHVTQTFPLSSSTGPVAVGAIVQPENLAEAFAEVLSTTAGLDPLDIPATTRDLIAALNTYLVGATRPEAGRG
jgi:hypothetical protein